MPTSPKALGTGNFAGSPRPDPAPLPRPSDRSGTLHSVTAGPTPPDEPRFDLSLDPPQPRNRLGWYLVIAISAFMVAVQLGTYLQRPAKEQFRRTEAEMVLRMAAVQQALLASAGPQGKASPAPLPPALRPELENLRDRALRFAEKDPEAARVYAIVSRELGRPVSPRMLRPLAESKDERMRLLAALYAGEAGGNPEELARRLDDGTILGRYAAAHARESAGKATGADRGLVPPSQLAAWIAIALVAAGVLMLSVALWIGYLVARSRGALRPLGPPLRAENAAVSDHLALRAGLLFVAFLVLDALFSLSENGGLGIASYLRGLLLIGAAVAVASVPIQGRRLGLGAIGVGWRGLGRNVLWGLAAAVANVPVLIVAMIFGLALFPNLPTPEHPITEEIAKGGWAVAGAVLFLGAVVAPIVEEIWFRGLLLPAMVRSMGGVFGGVFFSSLLFAMVHPTGVPAWPALAAIGAMAALLTFQTRSLVPSIVMHAVHNGTLLVLNFLLFGS